MHAIEIFSFGAYVAGRITKGVGLGVTIPRSMFAVSDLLKIFFLPSLAFIVESGITINNYLILVIVSFFVTFIASIVGIIRLNSNQKFYQVVFHKYNETNIIKALFSALVSKNNDFDLKNCDDFSFEKVILNKTLVSILAYIFLISGFFVAFMLALLFPENRLTFSQLAIFFHGFGTIILAFYLDPILSKSIDSNSSDLNWLKNIYSILLGRAISYLIMFVFLLSFLVVKITLL